MINFQLKISTYSNVIVLNMHYNFIIKVWRTRLLLLTT